MGWNCPHLPARSCRNHHLAEYRVAAQLVPEPTNSSSTRMPRWSVHVDDFVPGEPFVPFILLPHSSSPKAFGLHLEKWIKRVRCEERFAPTAHLRGSLLGFGHKNSFSTDGGMTSMIVSSA